MSRPITREKISGAELESFFNIYDRYKELAG